MAMQIYRVGGAVRDMLLGKRPKDHDYVVVGATVEEFLDRYPEAEQVGRSFPVFLVKPGTRGSTDCFDHDWSGEYAFARVERKVGVGHGGFEVAADPSVTLEQDLARRDLTINAMALPYVFRDWVPLEEQLIDPHGGLRDLRAEVLRHVGPAFSEDPLRVFRLARFSAQLGFDVAEETVAAARAIGEVEVASLSAERVCGELLRALGARYPRRFVEVLERCGHLRGWFGELARLREVPAGPPKHHAEGDALTHTLMVLDVVRGASQRVDVRLAALLHDLGKGVTPESDWPAHHDHDQLGVPVLERFCERLRVPKDMTQCAVVACREHMRVHRFLEMRKGKMVDVVQDADRTSMKSEGLSQVCTADALGKSPPGSVDGAGALLVAAGAVRAERGHPIPPSLKGENIGLHVRSAKGSAARRELKRMGLL